MPATRRLIVTVVGVPFVVLVGVIVYLMRTSHDEPIVIDNGPITVRRVIQTAGTYEPPEMEQADPGRWHLHHSDRFGKLYVRVWASADSEDYKDLAEPVSLSGVREVIFKLVDTRTQEMTQMQVRRDMFLETWPWEQAAHLESEHHAFKVNSVSNRYVLGIDPENPDLHLREIHIDQTIVCIRDQREPRLGPCTSGAFKPYRINVQMCTKSGKPCPVF